MSPESTTTELTTGSYQEMGFEMETVRFEPTESSTFIPSTTLGLETNSPKVRHWRHERKKRFVRKLFRNICRTEKLVLRKPGFVPSVIKQWDSINPMKTHYSPLICTSVFEDY